MALTALENVVYQMKTVTSNEVDDSDDDKLTELRVFPRACLLGAEDSTMVKSACLAHEKTRVQSL